MPEGRYDEELDNQIANFLVPEQSKLGYNQLTKKLKISHKVSSATLSAHLRRLVGGDILGRKVEKNGHTHYSLTEGFRILLENERKHNPTECAFLL